MNKKIICIGVLSLFLMSFTSAMSINFFYSDSCPHCKAVKPLIEEMELNYPDKIFNYYDISKGSYNVHSVPLIKIRTNDYREITLKGSQEIPNFFECEIKEMTITECPTYPAGTKISDTNSWFIR